MSLPPLVAHLDLDTSRFFDGVNRAKTGMGQLGSSLEKGAQSARKMEDSVHSLGGGFRGAVITMGALRFALMDINDILLSLPRSVAATSGEFERMKMLMTGLSKETEIAKQKLEGLRDVQNIVSISRTAPFEIKAITDAYVRLKAVGIDPTTGGLNALIDALAKVGGTSEQLKRISVGIAQMASKGVISMEELRQQLGEALPGAMEAMARGMGMSVGKLSDLVSKGVVEARPAISKMIAQLEMESRGAALAMMNTLPGALEHLKTEYSLFQKVVGDQGFTVALRTAAQELSKFFSSDQGIKMAESLGASLADATRSAIEFSKWLAQNASDVKALAIAMLSLYGGGKLATSVGAPIAAAIRQTRELAFADKRRIEDKLIAERDAAAKSYATAKDNAEQNAQLYKQDRDAKIAAVRAKMNAEIDMQRANRALIDSAQRTASAARQTLTSQTSGGSGALAGGGLPGGYDPAVNQDRIAASRASIAAANMEVDAYSRLNDAGQRRLAGLQAEMAVARDRDYGNSRRGRATLAEADASRAAHAAAVEGIRANAQAATGMDRLVTITKGATAAIAGFGKSLLAAGAYGIAFYALIEGATYLFDQMTKSARTAAAAATAALQVKEGAANQDTKDKLDKQAVLLQKERLKKLAEIDAAQKYKEETQNGTRMRGAQSRLAGYRNDDEVEALKKEAADLGKQAAEVDRQISGAVAQIANASEQRVVEQAFREFEKKSKEGLKKFDEAQSKLKQDEIKALKVFKASGSKDDFDKSKTVIEIRQQQKANAVDAQEALIVATEASIVDFSAGGDGAKRLGPSQTLAMVDRLRNELKGQEDQLANLLEDGIRTKEKKQKKAGTHTPLDELAEYIKNQEERDLKSLQRTDEGIRTIEEIRKEAFDRVNKLHADGKLETIKGGKKVKATDADLVPARNATAAADVQEYIRKAVKLKEDALKAGEEMQAAMSVALRPDGMADTGNGSEEKIEKLISGMERMREAYKAAGIDIDAAYRSLRNVGVAADAQAAVADLRSKIARQEDDLVTDHDQRERAKTAAVIREESARMQARISSLRNAAAYTGANAEQIKQIEAELSTFTLNEHKKLAIALETEGQKMARVWADSTKAMESATASWGNGFVDTLVSGLRTGKLEMGNFVIGILADLAKIKLKDTLAGSIGDLTKGAGGYLGGLMGLKPKAPTEVTGGVADALTKSFSVMSSESKAFLTEKLTAEVSANATELAGSAAQAATELAAAAAADAASAASLTASMALGGTTAATTIGTAMVSAGSAAAAAIAAAMTSNAAASTAVQVAGSKFANGGIMSEFGAVSLRKYANGGVANSPQLALYGEGSKPEAYVPLPDGRTIPVTMRGGDGGGAPNVTINVINQGGAPVSAKVGGQRFDGKSLILDVVLSGMSQPGAFRDSMKNVMGSK